MIVFFDTTALVKLVVDEPGSDLAADLWDATDRPAACLLAYPEARAALAGAKRGRRLTAAGLARAKQNFEEIWSMIFVIGVDEGIARRAGEFAEGRALRGYDAVHLASALAVGTTDSVLATWDRDLWNAARREGCAVAPFEIT